MNTRFFKKIGALCLLLSGANALQAHQTAAINQKIEELASTMHDAMVSSGEGDISYAQIEDSLRNHIGVRFIKDVMPNNEEAPTQADLLNLEAGKHHHKHHHHKHHNKHHNKHHHKANQTQSHAQPPKQQTFVKQQSQGGPEFTSQLFSVPIDEVKAITMKVSTTFDRDIIDSVTLKSFRKVIGYDTFESILNENRHETKDPDDHYNITVSMMVRRLPEPTTAPKTLDKYNGGESLAARLDKGFPYDDDGDLTESTQSFKKKAPSAQTNVGVLNGQNVTKESLVNLLKDTTAPVTQELVFTTQENEMALDKPAPIAVKLAQISRHRNTNSADEDDGDDDEEVQRGRRAMNNGELAQI